MNYPEEMCAPMRSDLTSVGFVELKTPEAVMNLLEKKEGTVLIMVNSVCGCAAGNARPAVKIATNFDKMAVNNTASGSDNNNPATVIEVSGLSGTNVSLSIGKSF